jgi:hypothetical protein
MKPMLLMTRIVINASTSAAIGRSHIAVLLAPDVTAAASASSDLSPGTVPSIATADSSASS